MPSLIISALRLFSAYRSVLLAIPISRRTAVRRVRLQRPPTPWSDAPSTRKPAASRCPPRQTRSPAARTGNPFGGSRPPLREGRAQADLLVLRYPFLPDVPQQACRWKTFEEPRVRFAHRHAVITRLLLPQPSCHWQVVAVRHATAARAGTMFRCGMHHAFKGLSPRK